MIALLWALVMPVSGECATCHVEEAAHFADSRHARAATLPVFLFPLRQAKERAGWCLGCHRPEGRGTVGLSCQSCHGVPGEPGTVYGTKPPSPRAQRAHPVRVEPDVLRVRCARCHEFNTPLPGSSAKMVDSREPLQTTLSELRQHNSTMGCSACHDPHRAKGAHDGATLRSALRLLVREVPGGTEVELTASGVGHRFPTGDPFRRLVIQAYADDSWQEPLDAQRITRGFGLQKGRWVLLQDSSLRDGETRIIRFTGARSIRAWFAYGDPRFERQLPESEVFFELGRWRLTDTANWSAP